MFFQVTKQQKTPQKKKHKDDNVNNNMSTPPKSVPESSPPQISKEEKQSHIPESSEHKTVHESGSRSKKTPPKQQTPNKRKSRLAANFSGVQQNKIKLSSCEWNVFKSFTIFFCLFFLHTTIYQMTFCQRTKFSVFVIPFGMFFSRRNFSYQFY